MVRGIDNVKYVAGIDNLNLTRIDRRIDRRKRKKISLTL